MTKKKKKDTPLEAFFDPSINWEEDTNMGEVVGHSGIANLGDITFQTKDLDFNMGYVQPTVTGNDFIPWDQTIPLPYIYKQPYEYEPLKPIEWKIEMPKVDTFPLVDIAQGKNIYCLQLAVAGMTKDSVNVTIKDSTVTIKGRVDNACHQIQDTALIQQEIKRSEFTKTIRLPDEVDPDSPKATLLDGILTLTFFYKLVEESKGVLKVDIL